MFAIVVHASRDRGNGYSEWLHREIVPADAATIVAELEAAGWYVWMVDELPANPAAAALTPADIAHLSGVTA